MATVDIVYNVYDGNLAKATQNLNEVLQDKIRDVISLKRTEMITNYFNEENDLTEALFVYEAESAKVKAFVRKELDSMGADEITDLSPDQKRKLFDKVDSNFKAKNEEELVFETMEEVFEHLESLDENVVSKGARQFARAFMGAKDVAAKKAVLEKGLRHHLRGSGDLDRLLKKVGKLKMDTDLTGFAAEFAIKLSKSAA